VSELENYEDEVRGWIHIAKDYEERLTRTEKELRIVMQERDCYKAYIDQIVQLKADMLLTQPLPPMIVKVEP
jgi:hypothetical protein